MSSTIQWTNLFLTFFFSFHLCFFRFPFDYFLYLFHIIDFSSGNYLNSPFFFLIYFWLLLVFFSFHSRINFNFSFFFISLFHSFFFLIFGFFIFFLRFSLLFVYSLLCCVYFNILCRNSKYINNNIACQFLRLIFSHFQINW